MRAQHAGSEYLEVGGPARRVIRGWNNARQDTYDEEDDVRGCVWTGELRHVNVLDDQLFLAGYATDPRPGTYR